MNDLSIMISNIVDELSKDELFEKVDKKEICEFLNSKKDMLPKDITYDELYKRIRKIMAVEAISHLLNGLTKEEIEDLEKSWKRNNEINIDIDDDKLLDLTILLDDVCETWDRGWEKIIPNLSSHKDRDKV